MELEHSKDPQPLNFNQEDGEIDTVYSSERILGKGTFGVVYKCRVGDSDTFGAIKRVFADPNSHQREWELLKKLQHPNIVKLIHGFYTKAEGGGREININYVFEYLTTSLYRLIRNGFKNKQKIPILDTKVYMYQILRGLAYIHSHGVCHRDIKPLNVIVNPDARVAKIGDFGSAKELKNINSNTTYIESRYYRAPELIFGNSDYSLSIDIWAVGGTFAEMLTGDVFFHGDNNISQLYEIMKVLGNPSSHDITSMNPSYSEFNLPTIETKKWHLNFPAETGPEALKLLKKMLVYNPTARISALEALCHPFFDELRLEDTKLDPTEDGEEVPMPALFNFTEEEKERMDEDALSQLIPDWYTED